MEYKIGDIVELKKQHPCGSKTWQITRIGVDFKFKCIYTPGHSKDSVTFYFEEEKIMFVGDFIFKDSIGRCDLPGGSESEMKESINKI